MARFVSVLIAIFFVSITVPTDLIAVENASWGQIKTISAQSTEFDSPAGKLVMSANAAGGWNSARNKSLSKLISDGQYDWVDPNINAENFPTGRSGNVEVDVDIEVINFDRLMTFEDTLDEMDRLGFRPATLFELLALGAKYHKYFDIPSGLSIIALGSVWQDHSGDRRMPVICIVDYMRYMGLFWFGGYCGSDDWFAVVRKPA